MPQTNPNQNITLERNIIRSAFGNTISSNNNNLLLSPYRRVDNQSNNAFVADSSNYTLFKKLQSFNREYYIKE